MCAVVKVVTLDEKDALPTATHGPKSIIWLSNNISAADLATVICLVVLTEFIL